MSNLYMLEGLFCAEDEDSEYCAPYPKKKKKTIDMILCKGNLWFEIKRVNDIPNFLHIYNIAWPITAIIMILIN